MTTTEQFTVRPDGFKEIRKAIILKTLPISTIAAFGGVAISYFGNSGQHTPVNLLLIMIPLLFGVLTFGLYRAINRQKELFDSYRIIFDGQGITREQHNTPAITIPYAEVKEIIKNANGSFTIKGNSVVNVIGIFAQIDPYEKVESLLADIRPISYVKTESILQKFSGLLSLSILGLMAVVYLVKDKILVGLSGTVVILVMGYAIFEIQRSKNLDKKTKKASWMMLVVIASIIATVYQKLTGQ